MRIIKGMQQDKKLNKLADTIQRPAYIITENKEYVEDLFLQHSQYLFNVEILTLREYVNKILIDHQEFARHIISLPHLVYMIRNILVHHKFNTIQFSSNPYEMILEIISTLRKVHKNHISLDISYNDTLLNEKCQDLHLIDSLIKEGNGYWTLEEMVDDLIDDSLHTPLYVISDDYPYNNASILFNKIDQHVPVTLLKLEETEEEMDDYEEIITHHLFDNTEVKTVNEGRLIIGGHPMQECMKVACDIKMRIVNEHLHLEDFMIITNQSKYSDYLASVFEDLELPHMIKHVEDRHYDKDYLLMSKALLECKGHTFKEIITYLNQLNLTKPVKTMLEDFMSDEKITPKEFDLFLQTIIPSTATQSDAGILVSSLSNGLTASKKHIYLMGINESFLPKVISDSGLLMEEDYKQFDPHPQLLDEQLQSHYKQIIQVLLNPALSYTFSYSKKDMNANELIPSILMSRLEKIFHLELQQVPLGLLKNDLYLNHSRIENDPINDFIDHYKFTKNQPETIIDTKRLGKGVSISRLETYNKCPFSYYIKYGLKINEKKDDSLQPNELGSLCHYLMETCLEDERLVDEQAAHYIEENLMDKYENHPVNQYFINTLVEDMKMTIFIIRDQLALGSYTPIAKEKEISGSIGEVPFSGIIDRVDEFSTLFNKYVRIIDYKSSAKDIDLDLAIQGFNIQMLVYLDMLCIQEKKARAGMLYFNMKRRVLKRDKGFKTGISDTDALKQYRMSGYMIDGDSSGSSIKALGNSPELIAPIRIKKSGEYYKGAHIIDCIEMDFIMKKIRRHISKLYQDIQKGNISIFPTLLEDAQPSNDFKVYPCNYCPYKSVCLFDVFENENRIIKKKFTTTIGGEIAEWLNTIKNNKQQ